MSKKNTNPIKEARGNKDYEIFSEEADVRIRFAIEVYNHRTSKGLSQQKLAKLIKTTQKVISNIENGDVNVGINLINRIVKNLAFTSETLANIFNCPKIYLFNINNKKVQNHSFTSNQLQPAFEYKY